MQSKQSTEKFKEYLAEKIEFQSEEALDEYYCHYDGHEDDERLVHFWKNVVYEYSYAVSESFSVNQTEICNRFILFNRVPCGLPSILKVLKERRVLADRESILNGAYYGVTQSETTKRYESPNDQQSDKQNQQSTLGWLASGLYNKTVGSLWYYASGSAQNEQSQDDQICEDATYISLDYLDRQADTFMSWAARNEKFIWSEVTLRRALRTSTRHSEDDITLLIAHLKYSGRAQAKTLQKSIDIESECTLFKLSKEPITQREEAQFVLQDQQTKLQTQMSNLQTKISDATRDIKVNLHNGSKQIALNILRRKNQYEKQLQVYQGQSFKIEEQLINLESASSTAQVLDTLSLASGTTKALLQESSSEMSRFESIQQEINENQEQMDQLTNVFSEVAAGQNGDLDDDLLKELNDLVEAENRKDQDKILVENGKVDEDCQIDTKNNEESLEARLAALKLDVFGTKLDQNQPQPQQQQNQKQPMLA